MIRIVDQRPELLFPDEPGRHVWVVLVALRIDDAEIREHLSTGERMRLDTSRAAWAEVGCHWCEKPWTPERAESSCPRTATNHGRVRMP